MKTITLTQPWASLVAIGAKRIETRSWRTSYTGPLAIHAAKAFPDVAKSLCEINPFLRSLGWPEPPTPLTQEWLDDNGSRIKALPLGCVVATCRLITCIPTIICKRNGPIPVGGMPHESDRFFMTEQERTLGNYTPGRWAWILDDIQPLAEPIPAKGALSLWNWEPSK